MDIKPAIREHAISARPNEACGFVLLDEQGGSLHIERCENKAEDPTKHFRIDPLEYLAAKKTGRLVAFYHTHNTGDATPTVPDIPSSEETGIPMIVYDLPSDNLKSHVPLEARRKPVDARLYLPTVYDCVSLVTDYYREHLNLNLPTISRSQKGNFIHIDEDFILYAQKHNFHQVPGPVRQHDTVLMSLGGKTEPNHMGVICHGNLLLHHLINRLSGYDVYGGYWEKNTSFIFRHESLL